MTIDTVVSFNEILCSILGFFNSNVILFLPIFYHMYFESRIAQLFIMP